MLRVADKGLQESISTDIVLRDSESKQFHEEHHLRNE